MSDRSVQEVQAALQQLHQAGEELGAKPESPFITLSFLALPVIPELKLTDKGLVDVMQFKIVPLWGE
jgi:adenine deaminase